MNTYIHFSLLVIKFYIKIYNDMELTRMKYGTSSEIAFMIHFIAKG